MIKKYTIYFTTIVFFLFLFGQACLAQGLLTDEVQDSIREQDNMLSVKSGFQAASIGSIMKIVIEGFLGLLGLIFIILMITAGFNWMTAGGDEQKVAKAKSTIQRAIIGLIIIVVAYGITYFVFMALDNIVS